MSDYIERQAVIDSVKKNFKYLPGYMNATINYIKELPSADVAPVVHSRWVKTEDGAKCEICGREAVYQIVDGHWEYEPWCPHCGARMIYGERKE